MSRKHFSWLLVATLLVGVVVFLLPGPTGKESEFEVKPLFPGLADQVNDIGLVRVIGPGDETLATLQRQDEAWVVDEFGGYPADWTGLKAVLAALAQANVIEPKTSNPDYFDRLGVADISAEDSTAILLRLGADDAGMSVLVGDAAEGRDGQYVRLEGGDRALLIDQRLNLPTAAKDWLQREIVDIADSEVVEVNIRHADGENLVALKTSADDDDFVLQGIPEGREVLSAWSVNNLASALSNLQLDDVTTADQVDFSSASQFSLLTADGLEVSAEVVAVDEQHWLRLNAALREVAAPEVKEEQGDDAEEAVTVAPAAGEDPVDENVADAAADQDDPEAATRLRAENISQRVSGWAYAIPAYKAEIMNKRMADVLKALPEAE
jgi:hypothetical protein